MPIEHLNRLPATRVCLVTGITVYETENDVPDEEEDEEDEDPGLHPGWAQVTVRRVIPNPDRVEEATAFEADVKERVETALRALAEDGGEMAVAIQTNPAVRAQFEADVRRMAEKERGALPSEYVVQTITFDLAPDAVPRISYIEPETLGPLYGLPPEEEEEAEGFGPQGAGGGEQ